MFSTPTNPRYKVVYVSKDKDGQIVFGARDLQTGELLVKKMGVNEILPNVMRQSTNKRFGGMSSSRKVGDVNFTPSWPTNLNSNNLMKLRKT